jgi:hypothetical protein
MRTHSGLHVLAGVVFGDFGALVAGGNMEPLTARMDLDLAEVPPDVEDRVAGSVNAELAAAGRSRRRCCHGTRRSPFADIVRTATNLSPLAGEDLEPLLGPQLLDRLRDLLVVQNRRAAEVARTVRSAS